MALRVKYRLDAHRPKRRQPLHGMGIHMMNRGLRNIYPNGVDVRSLGLKLITKFDHAGANHNGVAVEEVPPSVQAQMGFADPITEEAYEGIGQYNLDYCKGSEYLETCLDPLLARSVVVGALAHSHLLLFPLSIASKAKWNVRDEHSDDGVMKFPCDASGLLDLSAIVDKDAVLKQILHEGLEMGILSYKLYLEEPYGCITISNALNFANKVAFKTTELAALSTLAGYVGLSAIADKITYTSIKEGLRGQLAEFVDEPEFINMVDFVLLLGADKQSYLPSFLEFTSKHVSSTHRRLRLATLSTVNQMNAGPLGKIALCKRSLRGKPDASKYCPVPDTELTKVPAFDLQRLEDCLFFFHKTIRDAVGATVANQDTPLFFGNVDCAAADAFAKEVKRKDLNLARMTQKLKNALTEATATYWKHIYDNRGAHNVPEQITTGWPDFAEFLSKPAGESAIADHTPLAQPVLIRYNEESGTSTGRPQLRAVVALRPEERIALPYAQWLSAPTTLELGKEEAALNAAKVVLQNLHQAQCKKGSAEGIGVWFEPKQRCAVVITTKALTPHSLSLPPCTPIKSQLRTESTHPERVAIEVRNAGRIAGLFYIHPEWAPPAEKSVNTSAQVPRACAAIATQGPTDSATAESKGSATAESKGSAIAEPKDSAAAGPNIEHRMWNWTAKDSMHPIWAVRRLSPDDLKAKGLVLNMETVNKDITVTTVNGSSTITWVVRVPHPENGSHIAEGVELIWGSYAKKRK